jgi:hypothetical protein
VIRAAVSVTALALAGCAIGAGTSTVGIWRPHRQVDTEVCIQDVPDRCTRTTEVARDLPARSFGGGVFSWFDPGYARVSGAPGGADRFAIDSHFEYLRGRGGYALGARVGANLALGWHSMLFTLPLTVVAHWGTPRYSLYGGPGFTPYAENQVKDGMSSQMSGLHVMVGGRVLLRAGRHYQLTTNVDVFRQYLDGVVATSATAALAVHL